MTPTLSKRYDGFNIVEMTTDVWLFEVIGGESFYGSFKEVIMFAVIRYGFRFEQLEQAIQEMSLPTNNHNAAHFGIMGSFMYSFNKTFVKERLAS